MTEKDTCFHPQLEESILEIYREKYIKNNRYCTAKA